MSDPIDDLLVRYLGLLHEYTQLRALLARRQARMYGHLARANFAAERGFRYGPDHYDGRMQALARLAVREGTGGGAGAGAEQPATFAVVRAVPTKAESTAKETAETAKDETHARKQDGTRAPKPSAPAPAQATLRNPLQWFGVLTPMALRQAQQEAVAAVDDVVPRLATLSAEMAAVEIAVRRARKKRAKAAAADQTEGRRDDHPTARSMPT